jgi:hypothetical protein
MAIVDTNYYFTYVKVGCQGRISGGGYSKILNFIENSKTTNCIHKMKHCLAGQYQFRIQLYADDALPVPVHTMTP